MTSVVSEDITFPWGQNANPLEQQTGQWRTAIFEDMQESLDGNKLYHLYEPQTEQEAGNNPKSRDKCIVPFDTISRCFMHPIWLPQANGRGKFLFSLKCPSQAGGTAMILVTESSSYEGQTRLHIWRLDFDQQGTSITGCRPISDVNTGNGGAYICTMREDAPECIVLYSPGLNVATVNCMSDYPISPESFQVYGADLSHFYDGFLNAGSVYLLSASPDEHLDYSRVHTLNLQSRQINTHQCRGDPSRGFPPARKQAGLASVPGFILLAGGEVADEYNVHRLQDYWVLNCDTFEWTQVPASMPCPLIEPRITTCNSGKVYLWGDHDVPLPGMPQQGTHLRILKVSGMENYKTPPPSYDQSAGHSVPSYQQNNTPTPPAYPSYQPMGGHQQPAPQMGFNTGGSSPYPQNQSSPYPQGGPAPYGGQPSYPTQGGSYPRQDYGGNQGEYQPGPAPGTQAYYPPQKKDKDCSIM